MGTVQQFIAAAESQLGKPYVYGGDTPAVGFDCSGLCYWAAAQAGESIPRTTQEQWAGIAHVSSPIAGDLIYFDVPADGPPQPQHVMIYLTANRAIEAPHTGTVVKYTSPIPNNQAELIMGYCRIPFTPAPPPPPPVLVSTFLEMITMTNDLFLRVAYRLLLLRDPDEAGYDANLAALNNGSQSHGNIWMNIQDSPEGQDVQQHVRTANGL